MDRRRRVLIVLTALFVLAADPPGARLLPIGPGIAPDSTHADCPSLDDWLQVQASNTGSVGGSHAPAIEEALAARAIAS